MHVTSLYPTAQKTFRNAEPFRRAHQLLPMFNSTGPKIWNSLPASLRQPDIEFDHFKRLLKAFLFGETVAHE